MSNTFDIHSFFFSQEHTKNLANTSKHLWYSTLLCNFTETEGLEKLFYFEESENECAKERLRINKIKRLDCS